MKEIIDNLNFIKTSALKKKTNFCSVKDYQENEKISHRLGKDICKRYTYLKDVSKIYKEILKFNNMKTNNPMKKQGKDPIDTTPKKIYK